MSDTSSLKSIRRSGLAAEVALAAAAIGVIYGDDTGVVASALLSASARGIRPLS